MNTLWTYGCSFTGEYYPIDDPDNPSNYDKYKKWRGGSLPEIWPTILSKKLQMKLENRGLGGDSNYAIFSKFINVCEKINKDDILIFGWTNMARFQAVNNLQNNLIQILPCDQDFKFLTGLSKQTIDEIFVNRTSTIWCNEVREWIKFINLFCDKIGAKVFHWTSDEKIFDINSEFLDCKKYIVVKDEVFIKLQGHNMLGYLLWPCHNDGVNFATINDETHGEVSDGHFGEKGHKFQAEFFYNHIINNLK